MKRLFYFLFISLFFAGSSLAVGSSTSYKIATEVLDAGGKLATSTSYRLIGKTRDHGLSTPASAGYTLGEGFLRSSYYGAFAPIVTSVEPATAANSQPVVLNVNGANFAAGSSIKLSLAGEKDISATNVSLVSASKITGTFDITGAKLGLWTVTVTRPDGRSGSLPSAFQITALAPTISAITPPSGANNATVEITNLAGANFRSGAAVKLTKVGENDILASNVTVVSAGKITCRFDLTGKTVGLWDVVVTNDDNQSGTLAAGFKIESEELIVTKQIVSQPNPYDPSVGSAAIKYSLSRDYEMTVYVFNIRGERVWFYKAPAGAEGGRVGENQVLWDGITAFKESAPSGVYFVRLTAMVNGSLKTLSSTKIAVIRK